MNEENAPGRRRLADDELASIKEQLLESIYADIGRSLAKKFLWLVGTLVLAFLAWLNGKGLVFK